MAYTGDTPHNILNFTRVEHLYKRSTVYLRPAYKLSFTQQIKSIILQVKKIPKSKDLLLLLLQEASKL
jgi:hypothetical protein